MPAIPLTLDDLAVAGRWVRYSLIPFLAVLVGAGIWAHDTNATVKSLQDRQPSVDTALQKLDKKVDILDYKIDLLLEERRGHAQ